MTFKILRSPTGDLKSQSMRRKVLISHQTGFSRWIIYVKLRLNIITRKNIFFKKPVIAYFFLNKNL